MDACAGVVRRRRNGGGGGSKQILAILIMTRDIMTKLHKCKVEWKIQRIQRAKGELQL